MTGRSRKWLECDGQFASAARSLAPHLSVADPCHNGRHTWGASTVNSTEGPRAWLVRTGASGVHDEYALDHNVVFMGFHEIGSVAGCTSRDQVVSLLASSLPDANPKALLAWGAQVWAFASRIQVGDLAVLPLKGSGLVAIGRVTGDYVYEGDAPPERRHVRTVEWLRRDLPRANIERDLLNSLGAALTVCQLTRNNAASRLLGAAETGIDPGGPPDSTRTEDQEVPTDTAVTVTSDLVDTARDSITAFVHERFFGHAMEGLIAEILTAEGFVSETHGPGTDQGIDIVAGMGPLGLDSPRVLVQVKSSKSPVGSEVVQQLSGNIANHPGADQGLLVAWGGLTRPAMDVAQPLRFRIRVWTAKDVIDALLRVYPQLPQQLRLQIPLVQVWALQGESTEA